MTVDQAIAALKVAGHYVSPMGRTDLQGAAALLELAPRTLEKRCIEGRDAPRCTRSGPKSPRMFDVRDLIDHLSKFSDAA